MNTADLVDRILVDMTNLPRPAVVEAMMELVRGVHGCVRRDVPYRAWPDGLDDALRLVLLEALGLSKADDAKHGEAMQQICAAVIAVRS